MQIQLMANKITLWVVLPTLLLTGCGLLPNRPAKWVHPTNAQAKIKSDHYECVDEAWQRYPKKPGLVTIKEGYWDEGSYATTNCRYNKYGNNTYCVYTPATERAWVNAQTAQGDENGKDRAQWYSQCMTAKDPKYQCVKTFSVLDGSSCGHYTE